MRLTAALLSVEAAGAILIFPLVYFMGYRALPLEAAGLSFFFGGFAVSSSLFALGAGGGGFSPPGAVMFALPVILFYSAVICAAAPDKGLPGKHPPAGRPGRMELFLAGCVVLQVLWVLMMVRAYPVHSHDAIATYAFKAKIFHVAGGFPAGFFSWPETTVSHPDYPLFLTLLMNWTYLFAGFDEVSVNLIMPLVYLAFLGVFYSGLRRLFPRGYAVLLVFLLATIPQVYDYASLVHSDLLLAGLVSCGALYLFLYVTRGRAVWLVISAALFGMCAWVKNEGLVFIAAYLATLVILGARRRLFREKSYLADMARVIAVAFAFALPWLVFKAAHTVPNSDLDLGSLTAAGLIANVKDIPILLNLFQQEVFGPKKWNIFWILFFLLLFWKNRRLLRGSTAYLAVFGAISAAGYFTAYMATTGANLFFYVNTTISRFMLHFTGVALLLMAAGLYDDKAALPYFCRGGGESAGREGEHA